jgi:hypothetical protein
MVTTHMTTAFATRLQVILDFLQFIHEPLVYRITSS